MSIDGLSCETASQSEFGRDREHRQISQINLQNVRIKQINRFYAFLVCTFAFFQIEQLATMKSSPCQFAMHSRKLGEFGKVPLQVLCFMAFMSFGVGNHGDKHESVEPFNPMHEVFVHSHGGSSCPVTTQNSNGRGGYGVDAAHS